MREIEILFSINGSKEELIEKLQSLGYLSKCKIKDTYYAHPLLPELKPAGYELSTSVRVREKDDAAFVTWKRNHMNDGKYLYADEVEVETGKKIHLLLTSLGFRELVTIINSRSAVKIGEYEIVLDEVEKLGLFLEIEYLADDGRLAQEVQKEMRAFLISHNFSLGKELHLGKPELMLKKLAEKNNSQDA